MIGIRFCPVSAARARGIVAGRAKVVAFDQIFTLTEGDLRKLDNFPLSNLRTASGPGPKVIGGYGVYITLQRLRYISETNSHKREQITISIHKDKPLEISEIRTLE
jgi:hypothetical protein